MHHRVRPILRKFPLRPQHPSNIKAEPLFRVTFGHWSQKTGDGSGGWEHTCSVDTILLSQRHTPESTCKALWRISSFLLCFLRRGTSPLARSSRCNGKIVYEFEGRGAMHSNVLQYPTLIAFFIGLATIALR